MELSSPIFAKHGTLLFKCRRHINLKRSRKIQSMSELLTCSLSVARKPRFWSAAVLRYTPVQGDMNGNYTLRPQAKTAKWRVKTRQALEGGGQCYVLAHAWHCAARKSGNRQKWPKKGVKWKERKGHMADLIVHRRQEVHIVLNCTHGRAVPRGPCFEHTFPKALRHEGETWWNNFVQARPYVMSRHGSRDWLDLVGNGWLDFQPREGSFWVRPCQALWDTWCTRQRSAKHAKNLIVLLSLGRLLLFLRQAHDGMLHPYTGLWYMMTNY